MWTVYEGGRIMMYVKKPIPVEAIQYTGDNLLSVTQFAKAHFYINSKGMLYISTLEGDMLCDKGSYIIRGVDGEYYPCRKDIFEKTYEVYEE